MVPIAAREREREGEGERGSVTLSIRTTGLHSIPYRGTSLIRNSLPPLDHHGTLGIVLL
jgi:hypothetical protein